ncbi:NAD(P)/FAD-dependent oxidoreductase [Parasalinivibrio latis]|uniref:NAD(P)/FAD-dependent oxidoreductase n=1 Tax=Parasalinivibrio latis TaxID=2952610 RepID=UPI0030E4A65A
MNFKLPPVYADVVIIGSGPAGLSAATQLKALGVQRVAVMEREEVAGGIPRHCPHYTYGLREWGRLMDGPGYAKTLVKKALQAGVDIFTGTSVTDIDDNGTVTVSTREGILQTESKAVLVATGTRESSRAQRLLSGTRPTGVYNTGALQQFIYLANRKPCKRAVILGSELVSFSALLTLRHAGIEVAAMVETSPSSLCPYPAHWMLKLMGIPFYTGAHDLYINGHPTVTSVDFAHEQGGQNIACDGVIVSGQFLPDAALLQKAGVTLCTGSGGPSIDQYWRTSNPRIFSAGNVIHPVDTAGVAFREGRQAAFAIKDYLDMQLPSAATATAVTWNEHVKYFYPQRLTGELAPASSLMGKLRVADWSNTRLQLLQGDTPVWQRSQQMVPERRLSVPVNRLVPGEQPFTVKVEP